MTKDNDDFYASADAKKSKIIKLTAKKFNKEIKNMCNGFLVVYAIWCGHCRNQSEVWKTISKEFHNVYPVYVIDGDNKENFKLMDKLGVEHFPTIFKIKHGKIMPYLGSVNKDNLVLSIYS